MVAPETSGEIASFYSRVAPRYAEEGPPFFAIAGSRLVEVAQVRPSDVVLDLGTGRGPVVLPAARQVGPTGRAIGVDAAAGMLAFTRQALEAEQLTHASVQLMDVSALEFEPEQFTHVLSSFSVFFFTDLPGVLRAVRQLLRPNGVEGWWASLWTHGSRRPLERMEPGLLARVKAEALERVRWLAEERGVLERMQLVYVLAQCPDRTGVILQPRVV